MFARRRLCSVAVGVGSLFGQPSAYRRVASVSSTIVRIGRRQHAMGLRRQRADVVVLCSAGTAVGWHPN